MTSPPTLKSNDEDNTDSNTGYELALAHNHAQLHKKLEINRGYSLKLFAIRDLKSQAENSAN